MVLCKLALFIGVPLEEVELYEQSLVQMLTNDVKSEEDPDARRRNMNTKIKRYTLIALASVGGGVILGMNIFYIIFFSFTNFYSKICMVKLT